MWFYDADIAKYNITSPPGRMMRAWAHELCMEFCFRFVTARVRYDVNSACNNVLNAAADEYLIDAD